VKSSRYQQKQIEDRRGQKSSNEEKQAAQAAKLEPKHAVKIDGLCGARGMQRMLQAAKG